MNRPSRWYRRWWRSLRSVVREWTRWRGNDWSEYDPRMARTLDDFNTRTGR